MSADTLTEKQFMAQVLELAKLQGWLVYHTHDSRRSEPGFPDLVLVRDGRLVFAELKAEKGRVSPVQQKWLNELVQATLTAKTATPAVYVWRPSDWDSIVQTLRRRPEPT